MGSDQDSLYINEAKLILAEKRTNLATLRTGIAVLALPMGVVSFLIAVSKKFLLSDVMGYLIPLSVVCALLACLGGFLVWRSMIRIRRDERLLRHLKDTNQVVKDLTDSR